MAKYENEKANELISDIEHLSIELDGDECKRFIKDVVRALDIDETDAIDELVKDSWMDNGDWIVELFDEIETENEQSQVLEDMIVNNLSFLQRERLKEVLAKEG